MSFMIPLGVALSEPPSSVTQLTKRLCSSGVHRNRGLLLLKPEGAGPDAAHSEQGCLLQLACSIASALVAGLEAQRAKLTIVLQAISQVPEAANGTHCTEYASTCSPEGMQPLRRTHSQHAHTNSLTCSAAGGCSSTCCSLRTAGRSCLGRAGAV